MKAKKYRSERFSVKAKVWTRGEGFAPVIAEVDLNLNAIAKGLIKIGLPLGRRRRILLALRVYRSGVWSDKIAPHRLIVYTAESYWRRA